jgi:hypothetical protein
VPCCGKIIQPSFHHLGAASGELFLWRMGGAGEGSNGVSCRMSHNVGQIQNRQRTGMCGKISTL